MRPPTPLNFARVFAALLLAAAGGAASPASAADKEQDGKAGDGWVELVGSSGFEAWKTPTTNWEMVGSTMLKPGDPKRLEATPGGGVVYNGPGGRAVNLVTRETYGDVEAHLEFMVPKGSNSGVKFEGVYEIQIFDSYGAKKVTASHSGGVYPRAELLPRYRHIDEGYPPRVNASRPPGEWQTLDVVFRAPRFDAEGKKVANARFDKVVLNGQVVQEGLEVPCPTGHVWRQKERPEGPLLLQGDHGPVAFRNVRVRPLR